MVKPDASRNYYAELEVKPDACADDIRKAFRKLGRNLKLRVMPYLS